MTAGVDCSGQGVRGGWWRCRTEPGNFRHRCADWAMRKNPLCRGAEKKLPGWGRGHEWPEDRHTLRISLSVKRQLCYFLIQSKSIQRIWTKYMNCLVEKSKTVRCVCTWGEDSGGESVPLGLDPGPGRPWVRAGWPAVPGSLSPGEHPLGGRICGAVVPSRGTGGPADLWAWTRGC